MEDYYEYLDSNGVTTLYKLIKDDTVALIDSYSVTINGITTNLDNHVNNTDIHTPIATIEGMIDTKVSGLVNSAPETLDTLKELSDALGNDPNFATTVASQIGSKASKDDVYTKQETDTLLEGKADSVHNHVVKDITDFPTIPTKTSELSNDSNFVASTELHDYATKNDLNSKQDALSEEQLSNIDSIPDKANKSDLSTVATSGSYKDLLDKPVLPEGADLSDYYNKGETDNLLNSKANTSDLAVVAKSGNYNDLNNTPTIPTKLSQLENDMGFGSGSGGVITSISWTNITDKPNFATIATSGSYNDLSNKPTIPKVYNKTLTIQKNGTNVATFTSNSNTDVTANITVPTKISELSNDSGFITGISWDKVTNKPTLAKVATSGSYTDLSNIPTIPTKVSQLENDTGFINALTDVVDTKSNQTINGTKTFTKAPIVSNNATTNGYAIKLNTIARNDVPSTTYYSVLRTVDKNDEILGDYVVMKTNKGATNAQINIRSEDSNGNQLINAVNFSMANDNSSVSFAPSISNKVSLGTSTYKWAKVYSDDVVHTSGNETIAGKKTFSNQMYLGGGGSSYGLISAKDNNSILRLFGGISPSTGANLDLYGEGLSDGGFSLRARTSDKIVGLDGKVDGTLKWNGKYVALDENLVHKTGREVISGDKIFQNAIYRQADITTSTVETVYILEDTNAKPCGSIYNRMHWYNNNVYNRHQAYNATSGKDMYFEVLSHNDGSGVVNTGGSVTNNKNLTTVTKATDVTYVATMGWVNNPATSTNVVHRSGNETINGLKTFNNNLTFCANVNKKNNDVDRSVKPTSDISSNFVFLDKNNSVLGYLNHTHKTDGVNHIGVYVKDSNNGDHGFRVTVNNVVLPLSNNTYSLGSNSYKWANVYSTNNITNKVITYSVTNHNNTSSMTVSGGSSWDTGSTLFLYGNSHANHPGAFNLTAKNTTNESKLIGFPNGILSWNGCIESHEFRSTTANAFMAQYGGYTFLIRNDGSNTYLLMSDKDGTPGTWSTARPLIINNSTGVCNINGHADSANYADVATYATTQATTDNSTRIATTAWVRTYVNSVVGSNTVGSSVSAYWSNSSNVTATGQASATNGYYPACYSDYINKTPTVGTIYSGAQLYTEYGTSASATGTLQSQGQYSTRITTTQAQVTFRSPISATGKYLCTTANTVKFRAYTAQGSTSTVGASSIVDYTITKSIFIRVE